MARLQHPNIVRVFDIDSAPEFGTYLVMELIEGIDLGKLLRRDGRLPVVEALKIGRAVASALETAHAAGLVHRDIKPANILIEEKSKRAVVTDFGIAKQIESEENVTRTGSFIGTYRYCSPEQIRNERAVRIDGRADVYSLGVVLYEMCSGERFLEHMSEMQIAHHVGFDEAWKAELTFREPPPPELVSLIQQCLAHEREERPTAAEVVLRLERCLLSVLEREEATHALPAADEDATRQIVSEAGAAPAARRARRPALARWAMAAGAAAALLAAVWLAGRGKLVTTAPEAGPEGAAPQAAVEQPEPAARPAESGEPAAAPPARIASFSSVDRRGRGAGRGGTAFLGRRRRRRARRDGAHRVAVGRHRGGKGRCAVGVPPGERRRRRRGAPAAGGGGGRGGEEPGALVGGEGAAGEPRPGAGRKARRPDRGAARRDGGPARARGGPRRRSAHLRVEGRRREGRDRCTGATGRGVGRPRRVPDRQRRQGRGDRRLSDRGDPPRPPGARLRAEARRSRPLRSRADLQADPAGRGGRPPLRLDRRRRAGREGRRASSSSRAGPTWCARLRSPSPRRRRTPRG